MYTYILRCEDNSLYCGYTTDIDRRTKEHQKGIGSKYVRAHKFKKMEVVITSESKSSAMRLEAAIKKLSKKKKEQLVSGEIEILQSLNINFNHFVII